jgi:hypothetical protein
MTGIDKALQDRVNTYGTNPAALQKRYQQSQKLIDLLALQQVKSDMQNAKNNIMNSMQNNPNTIAAQRQNEVLGMAKQNVSDKIQQTAGALGNKQRQQQAQMKKLMQLANKLGPRGISSLLNRQQARPQQARPQPNPMMAGIARAPAPNMQGIKKAAQGGIIGFAGEDTSYVPDLSMLPEAERAAVLQLLQGPESKEMKDMIVQNFIKNTSQAGLPYPPEPNLQMPDLSSIQNLMSRNQAKDYIQNIISGSGSNEQKQAAINSFLQKNAANMPTDQMNISGTVENIIDSTNKNTMAGAVGTKLKENIGDSPLGEDAITKNYGLADKLAGLSNSQKLEMKKLYSGLGDLMKTQLDPARLRRDRLRSALIGAAGYGDAGLMGAGIMRGVQGAEAQQDKAAQSLLGAKIDTFGTFSDKIQDDKRKSLDFASKTGEAKLGQQTQSILAAAGMTEKMFAALSSDAQNFYKDKEIKATSALGQARIIAEKAVNAANNAVKTQIAELQATVSRENNKLVQDTNQLLQKENDKTRRLQIGLDAIDRMTAKRVDRIKALETMYKNLIENAQLKSASVSGTGKNALKQKRKYELELLKLQDELDEQKENITKSFDLQIQAIEAKIKGITVN